MKKYSIILFSAAAFALQSCKTAVGLSSVHTEKNIAITQNLPDDTSIDNVIAPYKARLEGDMNTKISHTSVDLTKSGDNSALGNLLADYTLQGADEWAKKNNLPGADAAVINIGGIRTTIGKGDILKKSIYEVMPFENELVIVEMTGENLQDLFNYYAKTSKNNPVAGLTIEADGGALVNAAVQGRKVEAGKNYYIATSDYLALGGDNMSFFSKGKMISTGIKLRDLYLKKFADNPEISVKKDTRLIFRNKKAETNE